MFKRFAFSAKSSAESSIGLASGGVLGNGCQFEIHP